MFLKVCWIFLLIFCQFCGQSSNVNSWVVVKTNTENAVSQLLYRIIGEKSSLFEVFIDPTRKQANTKDEFKIIKTNTSSRVQIYGTSGVAAAWGFHYYLKEYCKCHISWDGDQIRLPSELPNVEISVTANDKYRFYQNVVTTSYSFVWWNWTRWERAIDWMALNGINLSLAYNGQEEIWRRTFLKLGLNNSDIDLYFTGPAFLSWNRMGNLRVWGGPLTKNWHKYSVTLQKLILKRMRSLGITPVLPAFAGFVPRAFTRIYPNANVTKTSWLQFQDQYCCVYMLSPLDPMFEQVGTTFLTEYINEFGTDHIYSCDSFNEMTPPKTDVEYLKLIGQAIYTAITKVDKDAIWVMQGWLFHNHQAFWTKERAKALLTSVPQGKMLILDLQAESSPQYERLESFFGQPFIWCMLHNFGGTLGLYGNLNSINQNIFKARSYKHSTMVGTGMTPEGIHQNYVVYDLMTEMAWRKTPVNLTQWIVNYAERRYGFSDCCCTSFAWNLLLKSVYNYTGLPQHGNYIFVLRPSFKLTENVWYDKEDIWKSWDSMVHASQHMKNLPITFLYDLVDITRQSLQLCADNSYHQLTSAFKDHTADIFKAESDKFLNILADMDRILASLPHFLLGKWIYDAKKLGVTPLEKHLYERNARNQITLWGPGGEINDYANKQWSGYNLKLKIILNRDAPVLLGIRSSADGIMRLTAARPILAQRVSPGLVSDYYSARWKLFLSSAYEALKNNTPFDEYKVGVRIFNEVEQPFTYSIKKYPVLPTGDPVELAKELNIRWRPKS